MSPKNFKNFNELQELVIYTTRCPMVYCISLPCYVFLSTSYPNWAFLYAMFLCFFSIVKVTETTELKFS